MAKFKKLGNTIAFKLTLIICLADHPRQYSGHIFIQQLRGRYAKTADGILR